MTVVTSDTVFHGSTVLPTSADASGIQGYAWHDLDGDTAWDVGEPGLSGWTMQLVDDQGQPLALTQVLEPDDYTEGQHVNDVLTGVSLSAVGYGTADNRVGAVSASTASTGQRVLSYVRAGTLLSWGTEWNADSRACASILIHRWRCSALMRLHQTATRMGGWKSMTRMINCWHATRHSCSRITTPKR